MTKVKFVKDQDGRLVCFSAGDDRYFVATCNGAHIFDCQLSGQVKDFVLADNLAVCAAGRAIDVINLETH